MQSRFFLWSALSSLVLGFMGLGMYFVLHSQQPYADEIISKASVSFEKDLKAFIQGSEISMSKLKQSSKQVDIEDLTADSLNAYAMQLIVNDKFLNGIVLFTEDLSYVFFRDNNTWITTFEKSQPDSLIDWQRLNSKMEVLSEWTDTYNFFMDKKNRNVVRQKLKDEKQVIWKAAKSQVPGKRDLLFGVFQLTTKDKSPIIAALMYKTEELGSRFSTVLQFSNPLVTILTTDNQIVTPLKTSDTATIAAHQRISKEVDKLIKNWNKEPDKKAKSYSFTTADKVYWSRIDSISPQNGVEGFAVTVAEDDILTTISRIDRTYLYLSFVFLLLGLAFLVIYRLKMIKKKINKELQPMSDETLKVLISKGETEYIEFKSSLRWDYREEKPNKVLEEVILKSIAAFANAKGGTLFIGVNDDLEVIGLEPDFNTLKKKDVDYFELHLRKLINNQYGIRFSNTYLLIQFTVLSGKSVCVIQVAPSSSPLYLKTKNKQGQAIEKFYVRSGNASHSIELLQEINEYIEQRFNK